MLQYIQILLITTFLITVKSQYSGMGNYRPSPSHSSGPRPAYGVPSPDTKDLDLFHEWKELEYEFPTHQDRTYAISHKLYVHGNGVPIDVAPHYGNDGSCRIFVTIPRFTTGVPMTLATVSNNGGPGGPRLKAYPNYSFHSSHGRDCNGITSVFRVEIDECGKLWVLDTGRIDTIQYCPPQLLVFDLNTDTLIHRYRFPPSQFKTGVSLFVTPIIDTRDPPPTGRCMRTKVYIADVTGYGLVVYDSVKDTSWRIQNKLMYAYPDYGTFTISGESFDLMDGILGMDISPRNIRGERYLYFHPLAASVESRVPLHLLDNQTIWEENSEAIPRSFVTIGDRRVQSAAEAMDSRGNLFFGLMNPNAIAYWNINTPYNVDSIKIVAKNDRTLQFASGVKVVKNKQGKEELWVSTCRFQKVMTGSKNSNEINFRIQRCYVDDLLNNRPCSAGTCKTPKINLVKEPTDSNGYHNPDSIYFPNSDNLIVA